MHETEEDIVALQALIDRSYAAAGAHMLRIHEPERRLGARELVERLPGMRLLALATVTADGRPIVGPVDIRSEEDRGFRQALLDIYVPRYGADWETSFLDSGPAYLRIEADRMFPFWMPPSEAG